MNCDIEDDDDDDDDDEDDIVVQHCRLFHVNLS